MEVPLTTLSWKLAWRYLRRHPRRKRLAFASIVSTAGVSLGVAALVIVMSVLGGLEEFISTSVTAVDSPLAILSTNSSPVTDDSVFIAELLELPQIESIYPYIQGEAVARMPSRNIEAGCLIRGVTDTYFSGSGLDTMLIWGSEPIIQEHNLPGVVLGMYLSEDFMHSTGDTILFFPPSAFFSSGRAGVGRAELMGAIETGLPVNDRKIAYMPIETAARMFLPRGGYTGIFIHPNTDFTQQEAINTLKSFIPDTMQILTWQQRNPALFASIKLEKMGSFAAILLITLVASFNITGTIARSVVERRRDIAVLKSLGGNNNLIMKVFLWEGLLVGITGAVTGIILGLSGCWLIGSTNLIQLPDVYSFHDAFPMKISFPAVFTAGGIAVLVSVLAALLPAKKASALEPVKGLRQ